MLKMIHQTTSTSIGLRLSVVSTLTFDVENDPPDDKHVYRLTSLCCFYFDI